MGEGEGGGVVGPPGLYGKWRGGGGGLGPLSEGGGGRLLLSAPSLSCHVRKSGGSTPPQPPLVSGHLPIQAWGHPFNPGGSYLLLRVFLVPTNHCLPPPTTGGSMGL